MPAKVSFVDKFEKKFDHQSGKNNRRGDVSFIYKGVAKNVSSNKISIPVLAGLYCQAN